MLERILEGTEADRAELRRRLALSRRSSDGGLVARVEAAVAKDPRACIVFDAEGMATVEAGGRHFGGGRFTTPSLRELRERALACRAASGTCGRLRLWVLEGPDGRDPLTDIGSLQGWNEGRTAFQVASQFNALEAPDPCLVPVHRYAFDPTQGPRAAFSAFPAALVRHYAAPGPRGRFVQVEDGPQIDLLADAIPPALGRVVNGYLMTDAFLDLPAVAEALEARFEQIRIGLHERAEVVFGHAFFGEVPSGGRITQCLTSTLALGGYSERGLEPGSEAVVRRLGGQLLRAAYLGTLLGAAAAGEARVVLTLIGGGAFGNPLPLIRESLAWAVGEAEPCLAADLDVVVNARDNAAALGREALAGAVASSGGRWVRV